MEYDSRRQTDNRELPTTLFYSADHHHAVSSLELSLRCADRSSSSLESLASITGVALRISGGSFQSEMVTIYCHSSWISCCQRDCYYVESEQQLLRSTSTLLRKVVECVWDLLKTNASITSSAIVKWDRNELPCGACMHLFEALATVGTSSTSTSFGHH